LTIPRHTKGTVAKRFERTLENQLREVGHAASKESCKPVAEILARIGDKWSVLVVMLLGTGPKRFNEMRRLIDGISQRMLTRTLRGLERDGFVTRTVFPTVPPRVDYDLTDLGRSLRDPISHLGEWAFGHRKEIDVARAKFDGRTETPAGLVHRIGRH
jgi:DNA-binding HxlR family transcriptional regulator